MKNNQARAAGVDLVGNRYHVCLLDQDGKHPRYYRGRVDTPFAQNKLIDYLAADYHVVVAGSSLALILLSRLGDGRVVIKEEEGHYRVWEKAGIKRGNAMARFAALLLHDELVGPKSLTEKEKQELMERAWEGAIADVARIERARQIIDEILDGDTSSTHYAEALRLVHQSQQHPLIGGTTEVEYTVDVNDTSFFAKLVRALGAKK